MVETKTKQDLSRMAPLYLIHPWLDSLVEREDRGSINTEEDAPPPSPNTDDEIFSGEYKDEDKELSDGDTDEHFLATSTPKSQDTPMATLMDRETGARRLVARLRQLVSSMQFYTAYNVRQDDVNELPLLWSRG